MVAMISLARFVPMRAGAPVAPVAKFPTPGATGATWANVARRVVDFVGHGWFELHNLLRIKHMS
jgi:hypothetical protein